ncbi:MarR family transcriptional regulator [Streptomyces sp. NPDC050164]|uniref:MarR family transcriptional regulator n=1 Tax=Streptomyces sp. NPDC050164 TaxID=3365605 RepID=UPI00378880D0
MAADIDSTVIGRLMGHDAFAHHGLGSSALMIIGALHARPAQSIAELVGSASVSRATAYRTLRRLADHGLVARRATTRLRSRLARFTKRPSAGAEACGYFSLGFRYPGNRFPRS